MNLATHVGRWSAHHPWRAIAGWILFVAVALAVGLSVGTRNVTDADQSVGDTRKAEQILQPLTRSKFPNETVLVRSGHATVRSPELRAALRDLARSLSAVPHVAGLRTPLQAGGADLVSRDRHAALVTFELDDRRGVDDTLIAAPLRTVAAVQARHPSLQIVESGDASLMRDLDRNGSANLQRSRAYSFAITLLILIVTFGGLLVAGVPVLLAASAVAAATGLLALVSHVQPSSGTASELVVLIGMAVGVDYSLFYLARQRAERAAGRTRREAVDVAAATSGRAVLVSGLTVIASMAGMFLAGQSVFASTGTATILVVAAAMAGSLTVLPAILAGPALPRPLAAVRRGGGRMLATRPGRVLTFPLRLVHRLWRAVVQAPQRLGGQGGLFGRILAPVVRRPRLSFFASAGMLVALALPALGMHVALPGFEALPQHLTSVQAHAAIERSFPGQPAPAVLAVRAGDVRSEDVRAGLERLRRAALATGQMRQPITVRVLSPHVAEVLIPLAGSGSDRASNAALQTLRHDVVPRTIGAVPGVQAYVTGETAGTHDFNQLMKSRAPLVVGFVLLLAFVLLLVTFRSLVVPLTAIMLNLLSVAAAYGVLVLVFQHHWAEGILGFHENGAITSWLPIFLFVILFGLSMDYHVFILSRVKELVDQGLDTRSAVGQAIQSTAGVVTSAAVVMVGVFGIFAILPDLELKQAGVGLAVAILLDATLVRAVLLPATMTLLGERNWYLPRALRFLPRVEHERLPPLRAHEAAAERA